MRNQMVRLADWLSSFVSDTIAIGLAPLTAALFGPARSLDEQRVRSRARALRQEVSSVLEMIAVEGDFASRALGQDLRTLAEMRRQLLRSTRTRAEFRTAYELMKIREHAYLADRRAAPVPGRRRSNDAA